LRPARPLDYERGGTGCNLYPVPGISPGRSDDAAQAERLDPDAGNDHVAAVFERGAAGRSRSARGAVGTIDGPRSRLMGSSNGG